MKTVIMIAAAILIAGCASTSDRTGGSKSSSNMVSEVQLRANNPYLLNCPSNATPKCDVWGGRTSKRLSNCRCVRL